MIPIGSDIRLRRRPVANYVLIGLNVLVFMFTDWLGGPVGEQLKEIWALDAAWPAMHQYLTYQFIHGDVLHLAGNMLFLWIFGNAVCDRMGSLPYALFYLAGGVFAAFGFAVGAQNPIVGASGAIAAVTTAFLALFPRVHITMLVWVFFIFTFQVPAVLLVVFKMILWDNVIAPSFDQSAASNVAHSAHLAGYAFGFVVAMAMLAVRALPRQPFDMLGLWDRWRRRTGLVAARPVHTPVAARPVTMQELDSRPLEAVPLTAVEQLREEIAARLEERDLAGAMEAYLRLSALDPQQVLSRPQQLEIANHLAHAGGYREAAEAYESLLTAYPGTADAGQVRLFVGLLCARYLHDDERAVRHLRQALERLHLDDQRALAEAELRQAEERLARRGGSA